MKKILFLFAAVAAISFVGCNNGGGDDESKLDDRLVGTKWYSSAVRDGSDDNRNVYRVYEFKSATEVKDYLFENGVILHFIGLYPYELDYPTLIIYTDDDANPEYKFQFLNEQTIFRVGDGREYVKQ